MQYIFLAALTVFCGACGRGYPVSGLVICLLMLLSLWEITGRMDRKEQLVRDHQEKEMQEDAERRTYLGAIRMEMRKSA